MGSQIQVIVGGILLVTAFLFGRHINNQPLLPNGETAVANKDSNDLKLQLAEDSAPGNSDQKAGVSNRSLQRSLRDRILGQRKQQSKAETPSEENTAANTQKPEANTELPASSPFQLANHDIVIPDFSHLENLASKLPTPNIQTKAEPKTEPNRRSFQAIGSFVLPNSQNTHRQNTQRPPNDGIVVGPVGDNNNPRMSLPERDVNSPQDRIARLPTRDIWNQDEGANSKQDNLNSFGQSPVRKSIVRRPKLAKRPGDDLVPVRNRQNKLTTEVEEFVKYKTVFGDTLHGLSSRFFGKPDYYLDIYLANKSLLKNQSTVPVNTTIRIPIMTTLVDSPTTK